MLCLPTLAKHSVSPATESVRAGDVAGRVVGPHSDTGATGSCGTAPQPMASSVGCRTSEPLHEGTTPLSLPFRVSHPLLSLLGHHIHDLLTKAPHLWPPYKGTYLIPPTVPDLLPTHHSPAVSLPYRLHHCANLPSTCPVPITVLALPCPFEPQHSVGPHFILITSPSL